MDEQCICPECQKVTDQLIWTKDCHGIVFRHVCHDCYNKLMAKGFDGEYYSSADECLDEDY